MSDRSLLQRAARFRRLGHEVEDDEARDMLLALAELYEQQAALPQPPPVRKEAVRG